ncbi:MAG: hypothetical protein F6K14_26790 [Symploca sp. SIO2C1]|nr:hypothetical protein [Symploca sp. SIO2C1]
MSQIPLKKRGKLGKNLQREMEQSSMMIQSRCSIGEDGQLQPMVDMQWGKETGCLNVDEAIKHGLVFLEAAIASLTDTLLMKLFIEEIGMESDTVFSLLREYREYRNKNFTSNDKHTQKAIGYLLKSEKEQTEQFLTQFLQDMEIEEAAINAVIANLGILDQLQDIVENEELDLDEK